MQPIEKVKLALLAMQRYNWEQGVAMQAFFEQGDEDTVIAMAKEAAYRRVPDGRTAMIGGSDAATDPCSTGEAMLLAFKKTGDPELREALDALLAWALTGAPRNAEGIVYHVVSKPQFWVDSMYMLPPYLAAAGHPKEAVKQIDGYWAALYDPDARLMSHIWDDDRKQFTKRAFWGVGNGWTVAGLARVIDLLPEDMQAERARLIGRAAILIDSLLSHMRPDALFHDVVDDPGTFVETNLSQMLAYTIFRGTASGWLPEAWLGSARAMRSAAQAKVDRFGLVRDVCGAPHFDKPGVAPEGQAFYLLMESRAH